MRQVLFVSDSESEKKVTGKPKVYFARKAGHDFIL